MASTPAAPLLATTRRWAAIIFSRETTNSISPSRLASVPECPRSAAMLDATSPCSRAVRALASGVPATVPGRLSASPVTIREPRLLYGTSCSALRRCGRHRLPWPLLTSATPSRRLSTTVAPNQSPGRTADLPGLRRTTFIPYTRRIYADTLPDDYWASDILAPSPGYRRLLCGSCSSGRNFAFGFLQIPARPGHPCRSANGSRHQGP